MRSSLLVLALVACDRPQALLICHNANCVEPTDPAEDDTIPALERSLQLRVGDAPAIDGIELDSFWRGSDGTCLFAHDLDAERTTPMLDAANEVASYVMGAQTLASKPGEPFRVFLELKAHVDVEKTVRHSPEQLVLHAQCAWQVYQAVADAAVMADNPVEFFFASFNPALLRAVIDLTPAVTAIPYRFDAYYGIPHPLDSETRPLSDYAGLPITIVEIHPQWMTDSQYEGLITQNVDLVFWMFSATRETLSAIDQYEPAMINTSEARLLRRYLED